MPSDRNIIKTKEDTYGAGIIIKKKFARDDSPEAIRKNLNNFGANVRVEGDVNRLSYIAKRTNKYNPAYYSGRFSDGYTSKNGYEFVNTGSSSIQLKTQIVNSQSQRIFVSLLIYRDGSADQIQGEFVGNLTGSNFYRFTDTGLVKSTDLSINVVNGLVEITGTMPSKVNNIIGEIRLI